MDPVDVKALIGETVNKMTGKGADGHTPPVPAPDAGSPAPAPAPAPAAAPVPAAPPATPATTSKLVVPPDSLFGKKEAAKPVVSPVAGDPDLPTDAQIQTMHPSAAKAAKSMRARIEAQNAKIAELEKRPMTEDNTAKIAAIEKSNADLQAIVDRVALEQSPRFRDRFEIPKQALLSQIEGYLTAGETDPERIKELQAVAKQAASLPLKDRIALIKEHAEDMQSLVLPALAQMDQLNALRADELNKSAEARKADALQQEAEVAKFKEQVFGDTIQKAIAANHFIFQEVEGNADWNRVVQETKSIALQLFNSNDAQAQAAGLLLGAAAPVYLDLYKRERQEKEAYAAELAKYQRAMPRLSGGQPPATGDEPAAAPENGRLTASSAANATLATLLKSRL